MLDLIIKNGMCFVDGKIQKLSIGIKNGKIIADGIPNNIINSKNISNLYQYNIKISNLDGHWRAFPLH